MGSGSGVYVRVLAMLLLGLSGIIQTKDATIYGFGDPYMKDPAVLHKCHECVLRS